MNTRRARARHRTIAHALRGAVRRGAAARDAGRRRRRAGAGTDPVVAKVNGIEIRESDLAMAEEDLGSNSRSSSPATPGATSSCPISPTSCWWRRRPRRKKLADTDDFKPRLNFLRNKLLMESMLQTKARRRSPKRR